MQQHPIPQNVTQYEFHLVGNMTLKQFLEVGAGVGVAVFFYSTNLPDTIKWGLIIFSLGIGSALAFMPFDGRPLDKVVIAFFKAIYSPTQYVWKKQPEVPRYFKFTAHANKQQSALELERQKVRKNLNEYLQTLPNSNQPADPSDLDQQETEFVTNIQNLFQSTPAASSVTNTGETITLKNQPKVRVRKLKSPNQLQGSDQPLSPTITSKTFHVPKTQPVDVTPEQTPEVTPAATQNQSEAQPESHTVAKPAETKTATAATQNQKLPFPTLPTTPNTLVGMVLDPQGKIIENAIIEVRDDQNMPIRALKTNKLGQFSSATPLKNGKYQIEVEKDNHQFGLISLDLTGQIVKPIEVRAQA